jgi:hypothetical protein
MDTQKLIDNLFGLADAFVPALLGETGQRYVDGARAVVEVIDKVADLIPDANKPLAEVKREQLDATIARVNAHADATMARLKGR